MKRLRIGLLIGMTALAWVMVSSSIPAYSQEDITSLKDEAFGKGQRPPAVFVHEAHNEKAEIEDCNVCHHVYRNGKNVEDESSEDSRCSDCHNMKKGYPTRPLMKAYHDLCKGCHKAKKAGPITCGECHPRKGASGAHEAEGEH